MKNKFLSLCIISSLTTLFIGGAVNTYAATQITIGTGGYIAFEDGEELVKPQPRVAISSGDQRGIWEWTNSGITLKSKVTSHTGEGRASVTAGNSSSKDGDWQPINVPSSASTIRSITGTNQVNWDLRPAR